MENFYEYLKCIKIVVFVDGMIGDYLQVKCLEVSRYRENRKLASVYQVGECCKPRISFLRFARMRNYENICSSVYTLNG